MPPTPLATTARASNMAGLPRASAPAGLPRPDRARTVTAVLGPTNTGKTHLAIGRMLAHRTGLIGLPLRLLAREVYNSVVAKVGVNAAALVTGEEKITPPGARYWVATVEAMPLDLKPEFVAIDEVQLAADLERGRVFTDRLLRVRGQYETLLLGALTARMLLEKLLPGLNVVTRPRMSVLTYAGEKKLTRLPPRSAVVAFSANEVYAIAELIRRQRGGAAIVMGALSPRTRNAQVELFQSGDVEFLIATDAIGMGLNLDVDHVAFASSRKYDGYQYRALNAAELGQIAGRAGRYTRDGTFGVTGRVSPFPDDLVEALETHAFQPSKVFQWRNADLDFSSVPALKRSLEETPSEDGLTRAPPADDQVALDHATKTPAIMDMVTGGSRVERLWEVCQVPDYRKIAPANHADLILTLFQFLVQDGAIPDDWIARQVRYADKTDGDIDTLSNRIAHIRTWTFVANRNDWLADPLEWRETTRHVEDRLSDALHERLMQRFVDRRTSVLMKRLRENAMLESEVNDAGDVMVEGQHVGALHGFRFHADATADDPRDAKALRAAAGKALLKEMERRADKVAAAPDSAFALGSDAAVRWQGSVIAKLSPTDDTLKPAIIILADETLQPASREKVEARLRQWLAAHIEGLLKPLFDLRNAATLEGTARGLAYRISEGLGSVERPEVAQEAKTLDQAQRAGLRALGVRFGAHHIFVPTLLKPAPSQLLALLWALKHADLDVPGLVEVPQLSASGRTSIPVDPAVPPALYRVVGFRVCGPRAVRIDILERLADQIRPLVAWRPGPDAGDPPPGAVPQGGGFLVTVTMTSLLGCSGEDFAAVLTSLGYRVDRHEASAAEREAMKAAHEARSRGRKDSRGDRPVAGTEPAAAAVGTEEVAEPEESPEPEEAADSHDGDWPEAADGAHEASAGAEAAIAEAEAAADEPDISAADQAGTVADEGAGEPAPSIDEGADLETQAAVDDPAAGEGPDSAAAEPAEPVEVASPVCDLPAEAFADAAPISTEPPDATPAGTADAEGQPEGPVVIEIWRVARQARGDQPRRRRGGQQDTRREGQRGGPRRDGAPEQRGRDTGPREGGRPWQRQDRHAAPAAAGAAPAVAATGGTAPAEARSPHQEHRRDSGGRRDEHHGGKRRDEQQGGRRDEGGRRRDDRSFGRDDRNKGGKPPRPDDAARQPRREKEADPDSPFAALAALKARMEEGGKR